ncbi:transcription factor [Hepatospora eriocheir]|uniref:Transcription factor n=1 Tax=Hepatospora eriocheir TaxID=1081669 RepID=A0A1X0Q9W3_9MICR|nr:transcription factor [Hepatospora eriocheir]
MCSKKESNEQKVEIKTFEDFFELMQYPDKDLRVKYGKWQLSRENKTYISNSTENDMSNYNFKQNTYKPFVKSSFFHENNRNIDESYFNSKFLFSNRSTESNDKKISKNIERNLEVVVKRKRSMKNVNLSNSRSLKLTKMKRPVGITKAINNNIKSQEYLSNELKKNNLIEIPESISNESMLQPVESRGIELSSDFKPEVSFAEMIYQALLSAPDNKMRLCEIYDWIRKNYPYYKEASPSWMNSIRHNLSLIEQFEKVPKPKNLKGKGGFWRLKINS